MNLLLAQIGQRVRALRREQALTLKQLATRSQLSERFVGGLEAGAANISVVNLAAVAKALSVPVGHFFEDREPQQKVIALLGLRGAGKSTIGQRLAEKLKVEFFELDRLVELQAGMRLSEIFAIHGEDYFRELEHQALLHFLDLQPKGVLATGGGLVTSTKSFALLLERARTVWLKATPQEHWSRVIKQGDLRPMQNRPHAMAELKRRLTEREAQYARAERVCVTSRRSVGQVVADLSRWSALEAAQRETVKS